MTALSLRSSANTLFVFILSLSQLLHATTAASAGGCTPSGTGVPGYDMNLYHYEYYDQAAGIGFCFSSEYRNPEFQQGGYATWGGGLFGSATGVSLVDLDIKPPEMCTMTFGTLPSNFNYPETFSISNFTMLLTGYFYAPTSGEYTFFLEADDLAYMSFGDGHAFDCCSESNTVTNPGAFDLIVIWEAPDNMSGSITFDLTGGVYYPIRLLYANRDYYGILKFTFQDPQGQQHDDFGGYVYQFPDEPEGCARHATTTTVPWTGTYTTKQTSTVYTTTGSDGLPTVETVFVVQTPGTRSHTATATTITSAGDVTATTTYTTSVATITGSDGGVTTETVYIVLTPSTTPSIETATTVFTPGTITETTTISTATATLTGSDGTLTIETTFVVVTPPEASTATTVFTSGSVTKISTIATSIGIVTGPDGSATIETTFVVVTPPGVQTAWTEYTPGSVTAESTYSTATGTYTGRDGIVTTETTYFVVEPSQPYETNMDVGSSSVPDISTTTVTTRVPQLTTSTLVVTYFTTTSSGVDAEEVTSTLIVVEIPYDSRTTTVLTTSTISGTVTEPTTISTVATTYHTTGPDGDEEEVVETIFVVEVPTPKTVIETETTTYTTGTVTEPTTISTVATTYYTTGPDGNEEEIVETIFIVEVPSVEETIITASTLYTPGTVTITTTVSTITSTHYTTGPDGNEDEVIETVVVVEVPSAFETVDTVSTIYVTYTGTVTSTFATNVATFFTTVPDGNVEEIVETSIYVNVPRRSTLAAQAFTPIVSSSPVRRSTLAAVAGTPVVSSGPSKRSTLAAQARTPTSTSSLNSIPEYLGVGSSISQDIFSVALCLLLSGFFF